MGEAATVTPNPSIPTLERTVGPAAILSRNIAISLARVAANSLVALALPAYLTHHLSATIYGAWVLILQLGAYVSFLDFGVQTGVAKFVAEYEAKGDNVAAGRHASSGFAMMMLAGLLGFCLTFGLASQVPRLFHTMPSSLYRDVRMSVLLVGCSLSFNLVCSVYSAVFLGLQRYFVPMTISIVNKAAFTVVILAAVALHGSLTTMGIAVAAVNVATALLQVFAWRKVAAHVRISLFSVDYAVFKKMTRYCALLSIWTMGMLCVSGLDITIVGHYDYYQTAYYSIATLPTSFILLLLGSVFGPMMPASSALSTQRSSIEMGDLLTRITRYSTILLLLTGLPLMVLGFPILHLWVGSAYAVSSLRYLRILVLANIFRSICQPYATLLAATGRQGAATVTAISEAAVNLGSSVYFASRFGAIGVAYGTLLGSFVSVALHFAVSMRLTRQTLAIRRTRLLIVGMIRPAMIALPSVLLLPVWWTFPPSTPAHSFALLWVLSTLLIVWFGTIRAEEKATLIRFTRSRVVLSASRASFWR